MRSGVAYRFGIVIAIMLLASFMFFSQSSSPLESSKDSPLQFTLDPQVTKLLSNNKGTPAVEDVSNNSTNMAISNAYRHGAKPLNSESGFLDKISMPNKQTLMHESMVKKSLLEGMIPPNVHYMWCGHSGRLFEFKHYLSVISVIRVINPDKIVIHYNVAPQIDVNLYNLWIEDLKRDYQFLILEEMKGDLEHYCKSERSAQIDMVLSVLNQEGGMYISENTWLLNLTSERRLSDFESSLEATSLDGYILMRGGLYKNKVYLEDILKDNTIRKNHQACSPIHHVYRDTVATDCYIVKGRKFNQFWPMDIWELKDPFGRLCRKLFYGREKILRPKPSYDTLVPNIGHMVWIGGGRMDFVFYLSLLSMLYVAKVDIVYIHGDKDPTGVHWDSLQQNSRIRNRIKCIRRTPPSMVYQGVIEPWYRALMSDIIRVDLMIKYGGVYTDTDAIWVKPLSLEERGYDAVACFDWVDWSYPYPDSVNFGISYGKKNAPFWRLFRESMRVLHNDLHGFTGVMNPYRLMEKNPSLIRIDKRLSVICYYSRCHPIWVKDYHNMTNDHVNSHSIPNWKEDVHAFHWTHPNPPEYANRTTLLNSKGIFAEIGKFVLKSAGLL